VHLSRKAESLLHASRGDDIVKAQVYAILAVADALQNISASIDDLKKDFLSVEVTSPIQLDFRDVLSVQHKEI
jgi:hypothetical protein